jgi:NAD(P)-dependent dehydrogenase (short-subunit alcohol dehydrogenase family)
MRIRDSVGFVTGANRGLRLGFAQELLAAGARKVHGSAQNPRRMTLDPVARVRLDVMEPNTIAAAVHESTDVHLFINNAGVAAWSSLLAPNVVENAWSDMETSYFRPLALSRAFAPVLAGRDEVFAGELTRQVKARLSDEVGICLNYHPQRADAAAR